MKGKCYPVGQRALFKEHAVISCITISPLGVAVPCCECTLRQRGTVSLTILRSHWGSESSTQKYELQRKGQPSSRCSHWGGRRAATERPCLFSCKTETPQQPYPLCFYTPSVHKTCSITSTCVCNQTFPPIVKMRIDENLYLCKNRQKRKVCVNYY